MKHDSIYANINKIIYIYIYFAGTYSNSISSSGAVQKPAASVANGAKDVESEDFVLLKEQAHERR